MSRIGPHSGSASRPVPVPVRPAGTERKAGPGVVGLGVYVCVLLFLAPLKFGSVIAPSEVADVPVGLFGILFGGWPPFLLGALAGIALLAAVCLCPQPLRRHPAAKPVLGCWSALAATALIGLWRTSEWDYALTFVLYLCGVTALLAAALKLWLDEPRFPGWLLAAVVAGMLTCGVSGWHQRLRGFEEMHRFAEEEAQRTGRELSGILRDKLAQRRVYRPFFLPNSYAAHLVLVGPLALAAMWRAGARFEPRRLSQGLFLAFALAVFLGPLVMSGSRGALLGMGGGAAVAALSAGPLRRRRWWLVGAGVLLAVLLTVAANQGRSLMSASVRLQYAGVALRLAASQPLTGVGLGEFFPHYLRWKPFGAEETRDVHNLILSLLSQAGLAAGLAAAACLALPVWLGLFLADRRRNPDWLVGTAAAAGAAAWGLHALVDFNLLIPPTVMTAALLPLFCFPSPDPPASATVERCSRGERLALAALALLAVAAAWRLPGELRFQRLQVNGSEALPEELLALAGAASAGLPLSPYPPAHHGRLALAGGRPVEAAAAFAEAVRRAPHRSAFHVAAAQAFLLTGDLPAAAAAASAGWEWYPGSDRAMVVTALLGILTSAAAPGGRPPQEWIVSAMRCRSGTHPAQSGVHVSLGWPDGSPAPPISIPDLCLAFNALHLRTPLWDAPVTFVPEGTPGT